MCNCKTIILRSVLNVWHAEPILWHISTYVNHIDTMGTELNMWEKEYLVLVYWEFHPTICHTKLWQFLTITFVIRKKEKKLVIFGWISDWIVLDRLSPWCFWMIWDSTCSIHITQILSPITGNCNVPPFL